MGEAKLHAVLSPSSAKRWMTCTPSARLEERLHDIFGDQSSVFAEEGTKAHTLAELKLLREKNRLGDRDGINEFNYNSQRELLCKENGWKDIPSEMDTATDVYRDVVIEKYLAAKTETPDAHLYVEYRLNISQWVPQCFGTGDAVIVSDNILEVCDLKYGKGVPVSAEHNPQARCYGLGAIAEFGAVFDFEKVSNTIIQPRLDSISSETLTRVELLDWGANELKPAAEKAWKGKGKFVCGDHCKFCKAKAICAERATKAMSVFVHGFAKPGILSDEAIPGILEMIPTAEAWMKDIKEYALNQALKGQEWEGYKLVRGRGSPRAWSNEEEVIEQLIRAGYTPERCTETKLKSVSTIEKELGKKAFTALLNDYVTHKDGALTLVPESDSRVEYASADVDFSDMLKEN